jgi:uncharacterized RDD family membrane protein YckC
MAPASVDGTPAGFWARYAAWSLDAACLLPLVALLGAVKFGHALATANAALHTITSAMPRLLESAMVAPPSPVALAQQWLTDPVLTAASNQLQAALATLLLLPVLLYALLALPWAVLFEQSRWQATPGKRALGLRVTDTQGRRLLAGHALQRHLAAGLSWLTLNLGHALAAVPPHLALHDRISGTRVVSSTPSARLPGWARAWLLAQLLASVVAVGWLFLWLQAAMQATMQQALGV